MVPFLIFDDADQGGLRRRLEVTRMITICNTEVFIKFTCKSTTMFFEHPVGVESTKRST